MSGSFDAVLSAADIVPTKESTTRFSLRKIASFGGHGYRLPEALTAESLPRPSVAAPTPEVSVILQGSVDVVDGGAFGCRLANSGRVMSVGVRECWPRSDRPVRGVDSAVSLDSGGMFATRDRFRWPLDN